MKQYSRAEIESVSFWRELVPAGSISDNPFHEVRQSAQVKNSILEAADTQSRADGYFQTPTLLSTETCEALCNIVRTVVSSGLRPTYALLYDQFYQALAQIDPLLRYMLGPDYQMVPDELEVFYIDHHNQSAGTPPHRDAYEGGSTIMSDGRSKIINIWIPITDATPINSCMYVLPASLDNRFPERECLVGKQQPVGKHLDLQNIRALPATAGSVIGWNPNLLHWGSRSSRDAQQSRISFAIYFQRGDVTKFHPTTMSMQGELSFEYRLYLIEKVWRDRKGDELAVYLNSLKSAT